MKKILFLFLSVVCQFFLQKIIAQNILTNNPSFENNSGAGGGFNGTWTRPAGNNGNLNTNITPQNTNPTTAQNGTWFLRAVATPTGGTGNSFDLQTVSPALSTGSFNFINGRSYRLTFYYQNDANHSFRAVIERNDGQAPYNFGATFGSTTSAAVNTWTLATYDFTADATLAASPDVRIKFQFGANPGTTLIDNVSLVDLTALSVNLQNFGLTVTNRNVTIAWQTLTETNNDYFEIETSKDGLNFNSVSKVQSKALLGNSQSTIQYNFIHQQVINNTLFYRLKVVSKDGSVSYSNIIKAFANSKNQSTIIIKNNPVVGSSIQLQLNEFSYGKYQLEIFSLNGVRVFSEELFINSDYLSKNIQLTQQVNKGVYLLQVRDLSNSMNSQVAKILF